MDPIRVFHVERGRGGRPSPSRPRHTTLPFVTDRQTQARHGWPSFPSG